MRLPAAGAIRGTGYAAAIACAAAALGVAVAWGLDRYGLRVVAALAAVAAALLAVVAIRARPAAGVVALAAVLAVFPVARVTVGGAPIYFTDVLIVVLLVVLAARRELRAIPPLGLIVLSVLAWIPALIYEASAVDRYLEPAYGFGRELIAVSAFLIGAWVASRPGVTRAVLLALAAGTIVTSVLAILQSTGATYEQMKGFLEGVSPAFAPRGYVRYPDRAFAFFQAPTTLAGFLAVMGMLLIGGFYAVRGRARIVITFALAVVGPGLVATYSRQWAPAVLAALVVVVLVVRPHRVGRIALGLGLAALVAIGATAVGVLDADRLTARFAGEQGADKNIQERLDLQQQFFEVTAEGGIESVVGRGSAGSDLVDRALIDSLAAQRLSVGISENAILLEFFNHGIPAGILLLLLLALIIGRGIRTARVAGRDYPMSIGLVGALVAAVVLMGQDRYFTEAVFMKTLLWFLLGWLAALSYAHSRAHRDPG